jgi:hypothetical protein
MLEHVGITNRLLYQLSYVGFPSVYAVMSAFDGLGCQTFV